MPVQRGSIELVASGVEGMPGEDEAHEPHRVGDKRPSETVATDSVDGDDAGLPCTTELELAARQLASVYDILVSNRVWIDRFSRGRRNRVTLKRVLCVFKDDVRHLATMHLGQPATDGWNVVAGAVELARVWGLANDGRCVDARGSPRLSRATRMRLAVCLNYSWKFQRSNWSSTPREFHDRDPREDVFHAHELGFVGFLFLTRTESASFGDWKPHNVDRVRQMHDELQQIEAVLVCTVSTFRLLVDDNPQVAVERRIERMIADGVRDMDMPRGLMLRSLVPLFLRASLLREDASAYPLLYEELVVRASHADEAAGALLCAAWLCVMSANALRTLVRPVDLSSVFALRERELAWRLLDAAWHAVRTSSGVDNGRDFVRSGCYSDPCWHGYGFVTSHTLGKALRMARPLAGLDDDDPPPALVRLVTCAW